jgi:hypothetical protein
MKSKNLKILILILLVIILFCTYRKYYIIENFRTIDINDGQYTKIIIEDDFNYPEEEDDDENKEVVDMNDYILKSSIPPPPKMPNMSEFIHKSKLTNKQKDLLDNSNKYILKNKCNTEQKRKKGKKDLQKPKKGKPIISQKKDLPKQKENDKKLQEEQNKKVNEEQNKKNKSIFNSLINWFKNLFGIKNIENFTSDMDIVKYDYPIDIIEVHDNSINENENDIENETINSFNDLLDNYVVDDSILSNEEEHNKKITASLLSGLNNKRFLYN